MASKFIHLHVHSEYSLEDGIIRIPDLMRRCAAQGMPAVAITDHGNLFALVKFYKAAREAGIKPIIGAELWMAHPQGEHPYSLVLLCQNDAGYRNLCRLLSRAYLEGLHQGRPQVERDWLDGHSEGLIALSGAGQGEIGALLPKKPQDAEAAARWYAGHFPDRFYLELQRNGEEGQEDLVRATLQLAARLDLPVVATNNAHFLDAADFPAFDARVCISSGWTLQDARRPHRFTPEHRLASPAEMAERFRDLPEALENSVHIAARCNLELSLGKYVLPDYPTPNGEPLEDYFVHAAREGLEARLTEMGVKGADAAPYRERLIREAEVIRQMGFPGYFLIVADFIQWAKGQGIPVGPGRGSGAGSLVAYSLGITDLDPIRNGLLFERFLNPERVSMPDFDVDFCMIGRDRVIDYVAEKYGRDRVGQIITFGTMKARAVVRDVGRVLGLPYGFVDQLAKLVPGDLGMTLEKALAESEELQRRRAEEDDVQELLDIAIRLEGLARHASTHAGGVVIAPMPLRDRLPLFSDGESGGNVTQLDKDDVEKMGLVKFDFLGLRTLTIIDHAVRLAHAEQRARGEPLLDISKLPLDDRPTFDLLKSCETSAVFQLESSGMRDLVRRLQPDSFEDIVALVALFRPGPLQSGMVEDFIARKHGKAAVNYLHPALEPILKETYGVIVYQEQVMQCAQILAGYTLGGADLLRRAMGKKKPEEMAKQRTVFVEGAHKNGIPEAQATAIFDLMEKFAEYGFNKSHSAAYALVSYQTAWLKAHHPRFFMAAVLSADMEHTDKVVGMVAECARLGIPILPPDIHRSQWDFAPEGEGIRYGLGAIKGLGQSAVDAILDARTAGPFASLFDFLCRVDGRRVNRRACEALLKAGAMDGLGASRATLMASLDSAAGAASQWQGARESGQDSLFGGAAALPPAPPLLVSEEWSLQDTLRQERETLGLYLSGHPLDSLREDLEGLGVTRLAALRPGQTALVAGLVVASRSTRTRRGDRVHFLTLDDKSGRCDVVAFTETWQAGKQFLLADTPLLVFGDVAEDAYAGGIRLTAQRILDLAEARRLLARKLLVTVPADFPPARVTEFARLLATHPGETVLELRCRRPTADVRLRVDGSAGRVAVTEDLLAGLSTLFGDGCWTIDTHPPQTLGNNVVHLPARAAGGRH